MTSEQHPSQAPSVPPARRVDASRGSEAADAVREGARIMTICNACRYCEGFCAVFPAMERRLSFAAADMNYLANLCHNCSECLHACQYAAPHEFAINIPVTMARIRVRSYEKYSWPGALGAAFRLHGIATILGLVALLVACMLVATGVLRGQGPAASGPADFYSVIPHAVLAGTFGAVFALVVCAMVIGVVRYVRDTDGQSGSPALHDIGTGLRDALTLKYLHGAGDDCTSRQDVRSPWRRWFHHLTLYGFLLCLASTTVAAAYDLFLGLPAPYPVSSLPVVLGLVGGIGLFIGPLGLWASRGLRDPASRDPDQAGLEQGFILLLVLTSATGLALLAFRETAAMGLLLVIHLAIVMTLFLTLPYGKFVHGLYRAAALVHYARESRTP